jgi:hypothetical protein
MRHVGEARLQQFILDELDVESRLRIEQHMASCTECRRRLGVEQKLDEWLLESVPMSLPGAAEQSLSRLWASIDQAPGRPDPSSASTRSGRPALRRSLAPWWPAAAAAAAVMLLWWLDGAALDAPVGDGRDELPFVSHSEPAIRPVSVQVSEPVDPVRLADAQRRTADVLLAAESAWPAARVQFDEACHEGFANLRREGWPVSSLVRGWALGDDPLVARAALRYAACDAATWGVLAAGLEGDGLRVEAVLSLLQQDVTPVEDCLALNRALERRAASPKADGRCVPLLAAASGPRSERALTRLLERRLDRTLGDPGSDSAAEALLQIVALLPADQALVALMRAGSEPPQASAMRAAFLARVTTDRHACVRALEAALEQRDRGPVLLDWSLAAELHELVPSLLARLEGDPGDAAVLSTLVALGGLEVAEGLAQLWEAEFGSQAETFRLGLVDVLNADADVARLLGRQLADSGSEPARRLADALPYELVMPLLFGCLSGQAAEQDGSGHQAGLLVAMARMGRRQDAGDLIDWIGTRAHDDPLLALAWAAAARLDRAGAGEAWGALGYDPGSLNQVARATNRRFLSSSIPSDRLLTPLRRALQSTSDRTHSRATGE